MKQLPGRFALSRVLWPFCGKRNGYPNWIHGLPEACEYLSDPMLGERLLIITRVVAEKLSLGSRITTLMGSSVDTQKLISSITLFHHAAGKLDPDGSAPWLADFAQLCENILVAVEAQGYERCLLTLSQLNQQQA